jgi:hypothetical protein
LVDQLDVQFLGIDRDETLRCLNAVRRDREADTDARSRQPTLGARNMLQTERDGAARVEERIPD